jgi:hypothetical protein
VDTYTRTFFTPRQKAGHSLQELPYQACFKPALPHFFIEHFTDSEDDVVYDPFMGRGTTLIEAALLRRVPYGNDSNPLCTLLAGPRLDPPTEAEVEARLNVINLERHKLERQTDYDEFPTEYLVYFHPRTLKKLCTLKKYLLARKSSGTLDRVDRWIWMAALARLTGHTDGYCSRFTLPPTQLANEQAQQTINRGMYRLSPQEVVKPIVLANKVVFPAASDKVSTYLSKHLFTSKHKRNYRTALRRYRRAIAKCKIPLATCKAALATITTAAAKRHLKERKQRIIKRVAREKLRLQKALAKALNHAIDNGSLHSSGAFAGRTFSSPKIERLLKRKPAGRRTTTVLGYLNRLLLLDAYPSELKHDAKLKARHKARERNLRKIIVDRTSSFLDDLVKTPHPALDNLRAVSPLAQLTEVQAHDNPEILPDSVSLVFTSPPFKKLMKYEAWTRMRCWFGDVAVQPGAISMLNSESWKLYMVDVLEELCRVVRPGGHVVFEVGELDNGRTPLEVPLVAAGVKAGLEPILIMINAHRFTRTSDIQSSGKRKHGVNTNRIVIFRKPENATPCVPSDSEKAGFGHGAAE